MLQTNDGVQPHLDRSDGRHVNVALVQVHGGKDAGLEQLYWHDLCPSEDTEYRHDYPGRK